MYENTQGTETNNIIVYGNIVLGILTTALWGGGVFFWTTWIAHSSTPLLIKVPFLATTLLLFDRTAWVMYHACKQWTVTDAPDGHNFERTCFLLLLPVILLSESNKRLSDGQCEPEPIIGTILNNGKEFIVENTEDNALGFCDFIQNNATATLMWALCTVPILLLLGSGWKTLKATREAYKEITWIPFVALFYLCIVSYVVDDRMKDRETKDG